MVFRFICRMIIALLRACVYRSRRCSPQFHGRCRSYYFISSPTSSSLCTCYVVLSLTFVTGCSSVPVGNSKLNIPVANNVTKKCARESRVYDGGVEEKGHKLCKKTQEGEGEIMSG